MIKRLNMLGHEMVTTEAAVNRMRDQWSALTPDQQRQKILNHIRMGAAPLFAEAIRRRDAHLEQQATERRKELGARRLVERFDAWRAAGISTEVLNSVQQSQVDQMHERQNQGSEQAREMYDYTKYTEPVVADWLSRMETLGPGVMFSPSAERDDYRNGVDFYAHIPVLDTDGRERTVLLGIDYTLATREDVLQDKLRRNFHRPNRNVMHTTIGDPKAHRPPTNRDERFNGVVLALDKPYVDDLTEDLNLVEAHDASDDASVRQLLREYGRDPVLQYLVPLSLREQITTQLEELESQQATFDGDPRIIEQAVHDHRLLQEHFDEILDQRKNLRFEAEELLADHQTYRTFKVADRRWLEEIRNDLPGASSSSSR